MTFRLSFQILTFGFLLLFLVHCGLGLNPPLSGGGSGGSGNAVGSSPFSFFLHNGLNQAATTSSLTTDGKLLLAGSFFRFRTDSVLGIVRFETSGAIDPTFVSRLNTGSSFGAFPLLNPPGAFLMPGTFTNYDGPLAGSPRMLRILSDGTLDTNFSAAAFNLTGFVLRFAEARDGSGDVYGTGNFTSYGGVNINRVMRINSDGSRDAAFNVGTGANVAADTIFVADDGSNDVYFTGIDSYNGTNVNNFFRANSDGSIDAAFNPGTGPNAAIEALIPANDGSEDLLIAGTFTSFNGVDARRIARINTDGSLDGTLSIGTGFNNQVSSIALATDNDIYASGSFTTYNGTSAPGLIRLNSDGTIDTNFNPGTGLTSGTILHVTSDGNNDVIVTGAVSAFNSVGVPYVLRLRSNGTVDTAYSSGLGFDASVRQLARFPGSERDFIAAGSFNAFNGRSSSRVAHIRSDAVVHPSFSLNTNPTNFSITGLSITAESPRNMYVSWAASDGLRRFSIDGTIDTAFNIGTGFGSTNNAPIVESAKDGSGDVYVGGSFSSYNGSSVGRIVRVNSNGSIDAGFVTGTGFNNSVFAMVAEGDRIYVGGQFTTYNGTATPRIVRLLTNGTIDATFSASPNSQVNAITTIGSQLYVGGGFSSINGAAQARFARLNSDGSTDGSFVIGTGFNSTVQVIGLSSDGGRIYLGGTFTSFNGTSRTRIAALDSSGSLIVSFDSSGLGFNNPPSSILPIPDSFDEVYVGGTFSLYNNRASGPFVLLDSNGQLK